MTKKELTQKYQQAVRELEVARTTYAAIKELNDYEPCPQARAELQKVVVKHNTIAQEMVDRGLLE